LNPDSELAKLMARLPRAGTVEWIGVRPRHRAEPIAVTEVNAVMDLGLEGDHYTKAGGKRQVTLIQAEHLDVVARLAGVAKVKPDRLRRNIVVSGISLHALHDRRFRVGAALLEGTGTCDPCSRMEEALGPGGYNAMRGHGGITARILEGGLIRLGDSIVSASTPY
jgi:MOSC domain-containing protein YiiM